MPDVYASITTLDEPMLETIAGVLEQRSADPQQIEMQKQYFAWLDLPPGATVVEGGCGTGVVARHLASYTEAGRLLGLDPSPWRAVRKAICREGGGRFWI